MQAFKQAQMMKKNKDGESDVMTLEEPALQKICLNNFTPEAIDVRLANTERGCSAVVGEFSTFYNSLGGYNKTDSSSKYLDDYNGESRSVDRVKYLSLCILIRPILISLGTHNLYF